jgi:hypothetical protein
MMYHKTGKSYIGQNECSLYVIYFIAPQGIIAGIRDMNLYDGLNMSRGESA